MCVGVWVGVTLGHLALSYAVTAISCSKARSSQITPAIRV